MHSQNSIRVAISSFGMSGKVFHGPFLKVSPFYKVVGVLERTKSESGKMFPDATIYRSFDELLADDSVELVIVNTPNATHFDFARKALNSGKHVVVEKPFTITTKEGILLKNLAAKKNKCLSVYHNRRYDSDFKTIKKVLDKGLLGEVAEVEMRFDRYRLHPGNKAHKELPGPGTGNLYDLGSHLIDQAVQLFGMPERIFADIDIIRAESRVDDYFEVLLFYKHLRVRLHSTYLALIELPGYAFFGTAGSFVKTKTNNQEERLAKGELPDSRDWGTEPACERGLLSRASRKKGQPVAIVSEKGNYMEYYKQLYQAVRNNKPVPVTAGDAIKVVYLIELAYKSNRLNKIIPVGSPF